MRKNMKKPDDLHIAQNRRTKQTNETGMDRGRRLSQGRTL